MRAVAAMVVGLLMVSGVQQGHATNGMSMIGNGARMSGMGGTSMGLAGDTNLMNSNPAGISTIGSRQVDATLGLLMPAVHFSNGLNDDDADSALFPLPSLGYVHGGTPGPWTFGLGLFAQGGMGATYPSLSHNLFRAYDANPLTQDALVDQEYHSNIAYLKFAPTVAYQVNDALSVGIALNAGYAMMEMRMPYSIDPLAMKGAVPGAGGMTFGQMFGAPQAQGGLGYDEVTAYADLKDGVTANGWGAKLGVRYEVTNRMSFGASYTMKSTLDFSGNATMDMTSQFNNAYERMVMGALAGGAAQNPMSPTAQELQNAQAGVNQQLGGMGIDMAQGMADEYDVDIEFAWPRQFSVGGAYDLNDKLRFALDLGWINWKDSMEKFVMQLKGGTNANINAMMGTPDGSMTMEMPLDWDDQVVIAIGTEYQATQDLVLRGGFNYADNPVPGSTVIPIFPAVVTSHISIGAGYRITDAFSLDAAYEYVPANEITAKQSVIANEYNGSSSELGENIVHISGRYSF
jgi:long-chain fatty acid transport protein